MKYTVKETCIGTDFVCIFTVFTMEGGILADSVLFQRVTHTFT